MPEGARVESIEALRQFKAAIWKFQEAATVALGDAESEMHRVLVWLETEQGTYWQGQIRKRQEAVARAREALRMKQIFKDAAGRQPTAIEEQKALQAALRQVAEAEQKLLNVKRWTRALQKEVEMYKGSVQRFATDVQSELPAAAAHLESLSAKLDAYVSLQAGGFVGADAAASVSSAVSEPSMARSPSVPAPTADDELARLRAAIPSTQERSNATLVSEMHLRFPTIDSSIVPVLSAARTEPVADALVFVSPTSEAAARVFLHRAEPSGERDSGWSITGADLAAPRDWRAIRVADLLKARPDLRDVLALPTGFSVLIDQAGAVTVAEPGQTSFRRLHVPGGVEPADKR